MPAYQCKSLRLTQTIRADIRRGRFHAADPLPGEMHLAACYAVSRSTIRRTLKELVEQGVLIHKPNHGTWIAPGASQAEPEIPMPLHTAGTLNFGMAWSTPIDAFSSAIAAGARAYCAQCGINLSFFGLGGTHQELLRVMEQPQSYGLHGLLCWPEDRPDYRAVFEKLIAAHFPLVFLDRPLDGLAVTTVEVDNAAGMYDATMSLILAHRAPVRYFGYLAPIRTVQMRYEGYQRAMRDAGFEPEPLITTQMREGDPAYWSPECNYLEPMRVMLDYLRSAALPLSLVCLNGVLARGVYIACAQLGLRIPRDVRVVAFDDLPLAQLVNPPMTAVRQPLERIGSEGIRLLHRQVQTPEMSPMLLTLPVELIKRSSHGADRAGESKILRRKSTLQPSGKL